MTRHDRIVELLRTGEMPMPSHYTKSTEGLHKYAREFEQSAVQYIRATEKGRVFCIIKETPCSGMPWHMNFKECRQNTGYASYGYHDLNQFVSSATGMWVNGDGGLGFGGSYGTDTVFLAHHTVIRKLRELGYLESKRAAELARMTPETF